ncbi:hypothetical protein [Candidatus Palauibacter sp.]|uniref:hypothetical protein n=1 Tax=Candidatus Palauibacter sp. TaxID=3101350 RepID=UPI003B52BFAB
MDAAAGRRSVPRGARILLFGYHDGAPDAPLEIVPDSVTLTHIGQRVRVHGRGGAVRWSSRDPEVFLVDVDGHVAVRGNGMARVVARNRASLDPEAGDLY